MQKVGLKKMIIKQEDERLEQILKDEVKDK